LYQHKQKHTMKNLSDYSKSELVSAVFLYTSRKCAKHTIEHRVKILDNVTGVALGDWRPKAECLRVFKGLLNETNVHLFIIGEYSKKELLPYLTKK
jgi:hypothetical protein